MRGFELIHDLFNHYREKYPHSRIDFNTYPAIAPEDRREFTQFLDFARHLQAQQPVYEIAYQQLVHQFVLGGSRADLLASLDRRLRAAVAGQSALVLIEGTSGIGKTSLAMAQQVPAQAVGAAFIVGRCFEQGITPFGLWQDVVRSTQKSTAAPLNTLPAPLGNGAEARSIQHLTQALGDWLIACAAAQPLVIVLDDIHWADTDSLEVLHQLAGQLRHDPILFIATYRSEETQRGHPLYRYLPLFHRHPTVETIRLNRLTRLDTGQLVAAYYGPYHPQLADYLYQRAEGHPLFTIELLHNLMDQELLVQDSEGQWLPPDQTVPVPTLLQQVILQRVSRLGETAEKLLTHAAVVGETWPLDIVEHLADLPEDVLLNDLENTLKADLVRVVNEQDETYRFSHGLIREVLYTQPLARRRKRLHERIGFYLENQDGRNAARLAHHFFEAENWEKALHYCLAAGEQAAKSFANHRAIDLFQKALESAQRSQPPITSRLHMDIYERLGQTHRVLDQQIEAETAFSRMRDIAHSAGDANAEGVALVNLVHVLVAQYQLDRAERTAQEAIKTAEQLENPQLLAQTHGSLGKVLLIRGQLEASSYYLDQYYHHSDVLKDSATQSDFLRQQAYLAVWAGRYTEAKTIAQQCLEQGLKSGNLLHITGGYQILSASQIEAGQYVEAYHHIRAILDQTDMTDPYHHQLARLLNQMGYLFLELGDASQALMWDQRALEASQVPKGISRYEMQRYSLLNISTDLLYLGRVDEAVEYAARFEAMKDAPDYAHFRYQNRHFLLMSELHLAQNQYAQAIESAQQARSFAQSYGASKNIAKSYWFEGQALLEMRQRQEAVRHLRQAVKLVDEIQHGSLRWKIRLSLAKALKSNGESYEEEAQRARDLINQTSHSLVGSPLQESFIAAHWLELLDALGRNPSPEKPTFPAGLTQREVEVLRLVASGATNQQIADLLIISPRTVNTHITNILNKTGCENRTAASAFAVKHHLLTT